MWRELENFIERACLLARKEVIGLSDLHIHPETTTRQMSAGCNSTSLNMNGPVMLEEMERRLILSTLDRTNGNRTHAASQLGVSVRTTRNKLNQYGLSEAGMG
jgi:DNA-binding NtrC family response regulator